MQRRDALPQHRRFHRRIDQEWAAGADSDLPAADVVVITWTVDELVGLARVLTPEISPTRWHRYTRNYATTGPTSALASLPDSGYRTQ